MKAYYDAVIAPLNDKLGDMLDNERWYETWVDEDGVRHANVHQGLSEYVVWNIKDGKMVKEYDLLDSPF